MNRPLIIAISLTLWACPAEKAATELAGPVAVRGSDAPAEPAEAVLAEGDPAPDVTLTLHDGQKFSLKDHADALVFVYFYPKDDTPGCTVEAQGLRDQYEALTAAGVKVFGVSLQDAASHVAFIDKFGLPFSLAVDDGNVAKAFDVPVNGEYAARHSFLLKGGKVVKVWRKVVPAEHAAEVLTAARAAS